MAGVPMPAHQDDVYIDWELLKRAAPDLPDALAQTLQAISSAKEAAETLRRLELQVRVTLRFVVIRKTEMIKLDGKYGALRLLIESKAQHINITTRKVLKGKVLSPPSKMGVFVALAKPITTAMDGDTSRAAAQAAIALGSGLVTHTLEQAMLLLVRALGKKAVVAGAVALGPASGIIIASVVVGYGLAVLAEHTGLEDDLTDLAKQVGDRFDDTWEALKKQAGNVIDDVTLAADLAADEVVQSLPTQEEVIEGIGGVPISLPGGYQH
ncbi:hypothetical protein [Ferrimonas marina]|nr:hypothetical protein [Ferrimonas marina]